MQYFLLSKNRSCMDITLKNGYLSTIFFYKRLLSSCVCLQHFILPKNKKYYEHLFGKWPSCVHIYIKYHFFYKRFLTPFVCLQHFFLQNTSPLQKKKKKQKLYGHHFFSYVCPVQKLWWENFINIKRDFFFFWASRCSRFKVKSWKKFWLIILTCSPLSINSATVARFSK